MKTFLKEHRLNITLLLILVFVTYINAINNAFVSDDIAEIAKNPRVGDLSYIFTHPFGFIRIVLNWFAFHIAGLNPFIYRLINFFFHAGNVLLVYYLLNLLYSRKVAIFASAIFAVHPAISEAVVWISGGTYPQYSFFFLLSFILYIISNQRKKLLIPAAISFLFVFMSHPQMPLALFLIFPLYEIIFGDLKKRWLSTLPFVLITIVYLFINLGAIPERETTLQSVHYQERGIDNPLVQMPVAISSYLELTIFPKTLTLYHSELAFGKIEFAIRALITLSFLAAVLISFKINKHIFFWGSFILIGLAPTLTPFRFNWIVAERYLYLPSVGIFTLLALGINALYNMKNLRTTVLSIFIVIVILLSARTILRNIDWHSEDNLWIATGKTSPSSPNTHNNLGDVYGRHGDKEAAAREFLTAIALKSNYADAYHNLGNTYLEMNKVDEALQSYQKAAELNPRLWQSFQNIAAVYFKSQEYDKALEFLQKAIAINPKNLNLYINLGIVYLQSGNKEKAKDVFSAILKEDPNNQVAAAGLLEANK